ncbi:MAG TPA: hypothetical protein VF544_17975 [Pyrinomonadaceae bacterium]
MLVSRTASCPKEILSFKERNPHTSRLTTSSVSTSSVEDSPLTSIPLYPVKAADFPSFKGHLSAFPLFWTENSKVSDSKIKLIKDLAQKLLPIKVKLIHSFLESFAAKALIYMLLINQLAFSNLSLEARWDHFFQDSERKNGKLVVIINNQTGRSDTFVLSIESSSLITSPVKSPIKSHPPICPRDSPLKIQGKNVWEENYEREFSPFKHLAKKLHKQFLIKIPRPRAFCFPCLEGASGSWANTYSNSIKFRFARAHIFWLKHAKSSP